MKRYITKQTVTLSGGLLALGADQSKRRAHCLKPTKQHGIFEIIQPVQFKAGEEIGFDGDVPKGLSDAMTPPSDDKPATRRPGRPKGS